MNRSPMMSLQGLPGVMARRRRGDYDVDLWGADSDWVDIFGAICVLGLRVRLSGSDRLPKEGPAILVTNQRLGIGEPVALAVSVRRRTGRLVRPIGAPDTPYVAPLVRRFGMIQSSQAEVRSVLAAGNIVVAPLTTTMRREAGTIAPELLSPALELNVPVFPVATVGGEFTGSWRIIIGEQLPPPRSQRRTPLAAAELADRARAGVQMLLEDQFPNRRNGI
jgi:hypothetical protein